MIFWIDKTSVLSGSNWSESSLSLTLELRWLGWVGTQVNRDSTSKGTRISSESIKKVRILSTKDALFLTVFIILKRWQDVGEVFG